jgi:hypothetical protein
LVGKPGEKRPLGDLGVDGRIILKGNWEIWLGAVVWRALANIVMKIQVTQRRGDFLIIFSS